MTSLTNQKINLPRAMFSLVLKIKRSNSDHRKIDPADLNSHRRELSNGGLGVVVTLLVFRKIDFCVCVLLVGNPAVLEDPKKMMQDRQAVGCR